MIDLTASQPPSQHTSQSASESAYQSASQSIVETANQSASRSDKVADPSRNQTSDSTTTAAAPSATVSEEPEFSNDIDKLDSIIARFRLKMITHDSEIELIQGVSGKCLRKHFFLIFFLYIR